MSKRLYVGSLPFDTTDEQLQTLFKECGNVENAKVVTDKLTGRSRGFGFVEMSDDSAAQQAIQKLNGTQVGGRKIVVNEARPLENKGGGGGGNRSYGGYDGSRNRNRNRY